MAKIDFHDTVLPERGVLEVTGRDAKAFLSRLITADVDTLQGGESAYAALLTPQGKVLFEFFIIYNIMTREDGSAADNFLLDCAKSQLADLQKRLEFYRLRASVQVTPVVKLQVYACLDEPKFRTHRFQDPRYPEIGWRALVREEEFFNTAPGYHRARIALGLADSDADLGSGEFFPHEANLDQLNGVSFTKGCYVGQEVVSRMEHRGTARSRILPVSLDSPAPPKGSDIRAGGKSIGTLLTSEGNLALALIRLDRLAEAQAPLLSEGVRVHVHKPRWARYDVPGATEVP